MSKEEILSVITVARDIVEPGGATIFYAKDEEEQATLAQEVARSLRGDVIKLKNGCLIVVR